MSKYIAVLGKESGIFQKDLFPPRRSFLCGVLVSIISTIVENRSIKEKHPYFDLQLKPQENYFSNQNINSIDRMFETITGIVPGGLAGWLVGSIIINMLKENK